jgi:hypothetical protein
MRNSCSSLGQAVSDKFSAASVSTPVHPKRSGTSFEFGKAKFVTVFSRWVKGQAQGLGPGAFKLWVNSTGSKVLFVHTYEAHEEENGADRFVEATCTAPHRKGRGKRG